MTKSVDAPPNEDLNTTLLPGALRKDGWWLCDFKPVSRAEKGPRSKVAPADLWTFGVLVLLVALADLGFDENVYIGLLLPVALLTLGVAAWALQVKRGDWMHGWMGTGLLLAGLVPYLSVPSPLAAAFALAGLCAFYLIGRSGASRQVWRTAWRGLVLTVSGYWLLPKAVLGQIGSLKHTGGGWWRNWLPALGLAGVFAMLFGYANPLFASQFARLNLDWLIDLLMPARILFWMMVAGFAFAFLVDRTYPKDRQEISPEVASGSVLPRRIVLPCLILCNAVFAFQTVLDPLFLAATDWSDASGLVRNAQNAAYLLMASTLLSAGFVLIALPGGNAATNPSDRLLTALVGLFLLLNLAQIVSAVTRLAFYVDRFALTQWRLAAFLWMGLVAIGLMLIFARLMLGHSKGWLVRANVLAAAVVIWGALVADTNAFIADYNVGHSLAANGPELDETYLCSLGVSALPAMERLRMQDRLGPEGRSCQLALRSRLSARSDDWRSWNLRDWRIRSRLQ